jgi:hypothetical protein
MENVTGAGVDAPSAGAEAVMGRASSYTTVPQDALAEFAAVSSVRPASAPVAIKTGHLVDHRLALAAPFRFTIFGPLGFIGFLAGREDSVRLRAWSGLALDSCAPTWCGGAAATSGPTGGETPWI